MRSWAFLAVTAVLLVALGAIAASVFRRGRAEEGERPKHRMLEDD
jgi:hypothetical protein